MDTAASGVIGVTPSISTTIGTRPTFRHPARLFVLFIKRIEILTLALLLLSPGALASRKTDIINMYNGDRITGEIVTLYGGILKVKTDAMGTLNIEWPEVASLTSEYHYELRLSNGERLYGSFDESARPGQIDLVTLFGKQDIEWLEVVEIRAIEDDFLERLDLYLSTTFSYTRASNIGQVSLNTDISYENEDSRNRLTGRTDIVDSNEERSQSTRFDVSRATWRGDRADAFRALFANYEDNDELGLNRRIGVGAGIGRYFVDTHRSRLNGVAGLQLISERFAGEEDNQDVELILTTSFATWKFTTPELDIDLSFSLYPSLTDSGRVRSDGNLRIRWELVSDLYWDITAWVTTDNQAENDNTVDYAITTGVGWTY
ncbi:DUF481 domain-containing protein [Pseudohalioglobus sediminis]|uniref:DUF481 domain-containing protein n=1 Tax=Pseudohalioglobus sediminis TaxID=2606449 RepID=A0A5B0X567_9GAMM|nr:DUF481 domain-containing protein [Pseudohalioglobus sediminis]KAA1193329.1 DUF481 domain-containing protein [Pseudohalioglobus sediminis]